MKEKMIGIFWVKGVVYYKFVGKKFCVVLILKFVDEFLWVKIIERNIYVELFIICVEVNGNILVYLGFLNICLIIDFELEIFVV